MTSGNRFEEKKHEAGLSTPLSLSSLLIYKSLNNQGPQYIQKYLQPYSVTGHHLRSCDQGLLTIPRTNVKTFGDRAFARSGPFLWNKLPREIRISQSVVIFKSKLIRHICSNWLTICFNILNSFDIFYIIFCKAL